MASNKIINILLSLPVILIFLYFMAPLGIILLIIRQFTHKEKSYVKTSIALTTIAILIQMPKIVFELSKLIKFNSYNIDEIVKLDVYLKLTNYSEMLVYIAVILLIAGFITKKLVDRAANFAKTYIMEKEKMAREVSIKNDMEIKIKQEKAKNSHTVICPYCGADNIITGKSGICKYCRRQIEEN